jgi:glycosyltransferase involved in cell wall biosynthesis
MVTPSGGSKQNSGSSNQAGFAGCKAGKRKQKALLSPAAGNSVAAVDIVAAIPVFNDWESVKDVMIGLDVEAGLTPDRFSVLLLDDGSTDPVPPELLGASYQHLESVSILKLTKNLGHQKALALGLCHLSENSGCDAVLLMDGDGEDKPEDATRLIARMHEMPGPTIVFAERTRRSESLSFRFSYGIYRILHRLLTGRGIRVGNFSVVPRACLPALLVESMLWNHYAASVIRSRLPMTTIPTDRGVRVKGRSRLNFVALVVHGLAALACYSEIIGVRLIFATGLVVVLAVIAMLVLVYMKIFTTVTIPGWTSLLLVLILILVMQVATLVCNFTMQIISARNLQPFLPCRDYHWFIASVWEIFRRPSPGVQV